MRYGSIFSGFDGMGLGLERAGMECAWQVEIDDYCHRVLERHWPNVPKFRDVAGVDSISLSKVDVLAGGFPCQDVSRAGKRKGMSGSRSGLWLHFHRLICELRPPIIIVENVTGLLDGGIGRVLGDLAEGGYDAEWDCLHAQEFGSPQRGRERVFLVAYTQSVFRAIGNHHSARGEEGWGVFSKPRSSDSTVIRARGYWEGGQPAVLRMADGLANRLERHRGIGNAVMPAMAEYVGRRVMYLMGK